MSAIISWRLLIVWTPSESRWGESFEALVVKAVVGGITLRAQVSGSYMKAINLANQF